MIVRLLSVWEGADGPLLKQLLTLHASGSRVIDLTVNRGRIWEGSGLTLNAPGVYDPSRVVGVDCAASVRPTVVADNRALPFASESFDVAVYDPPHVPNQGADKVKDFRSRFGLGVKAREDLVGDFPAVLAEAARVLAPNGILLTKLCDYVHNHRYQWTLVRFVQLCEGLKWIPCDLVVKVRKNPIEDPKWKNAHHTRRCHSYWIVARPPGSRCEARHGGMLRGSEAPHP